VVVDSGVNLSDHCVACVQIIVRVGFNDDCSLSHQLRTDVHTKIG